jgi:hypothetical protein
MKFLRFARFFVNKIGLNFFKRKPNEWKQIQNTEFKKRKMFDGILSNNPEEQEINKNKKIKASK